MEQTFKEPGYTHFETGPQSVCICVAVLQHHPQVGCIHYSSAAGSHGRRTSALSPCGQGQSQQRNQLRKGTMTSCRSTSLSLFLLGQTPSSIIPESFLIPEMSDLFYLTKAADIHSPIQHMHDEREEQSKRRCGHSRKTMTLAADQFRPVGRWGGPGCPAV